MSSPSIVTLSFFQGDDERFAVFWEDDGSPVDLTNAEAQMDIRRGPADEGFPVIATAKVGDGITIVDGPGGEIQVFFSSAKTVLLTGDDPFQYDLQIKPDGGDLKTVIKGRLKVGRETTRE